jgi:hypothetical protein
LGIPFILTEYWPIVLCFPAMAGFWFIMKKKSAFWAASIVFITFILFAGVGLLANLSTPLMIISCIAALAWWDLTNFRQSLVLGQPLGTRFPLERDHLQSLASTISAGLILAFVSSYLNLQISIVGMILLVGFTIGCLAYAMHTLVKNI